MSNNDSSDPKKPGSTPPGSKPGDASSSGKKPSAIIDLKATEVRETKDTAKPGGGDKSSDKSAAGVASGGLKGAPGWQDPNKTTDSAAKNAAKPGASVPPVAAKSTAEKSDGDKLADGKPAAATAAAASASAAAGAQKSESAKAAAAAPKAAATTAAPPPPPPVRAAKSGGGGIVSTFTHLLAGVIGGAIVLFGVEPLEQQLQVKLRSEPAIPVALQQRLAALEQRVPGTDVASAQAVADLGTQLAAAEKRMAAFEGLQGQVASLAKDVEAATAGATPSGEGASSAAGDTDLAALRQRLAKMESTLATISSATATDGQPAGIAPLASLSGKLADVESGLNSQMASLRQSLLAEMDKRVAGAAEASAAAVAGTRRIDREMADLKTDNARLAQTAQTLQLSADKLGATVRVLQDETSSLKVGHDSLKGDFGQQLAKVARPDDVKSAVAPVAEKVASLEKNLEAVVASEGARKANASRIVLALELGNLKRVLDRGTPFAAELADVKKVAGDQVNLSALELFKDEGVTSSRDLVRQFQSVAYAIINAEKQPASGSVVDRLIAGAQSIVQVRRTDLPADANTTEAAVARIEKLLKGGDLSGALTLVGKLPTKSQEVAKDWTRQLAARAEVDRALAKVEDQLKASLGGRG